MAEETQTGYVVALALELLDGEVARRAGARLAQLVVGSGGRLETGFAGSAFLLSALEGAGYPELAYDLLLRTSPPSLGFMVAMGATSVWERWDGLSSSGAPASPIMNSFNHYAMSSMLSWLVEGVCGFRPVPGVPSLCEVRFAPAVSARVRDASFEFEAPLGRVVTSWAWRTDDEIEGSVRVPLGMRCTIAGTIAVDGAWARALGSGHVGSTDRVVGGGVHEVRWHLEQPATPGAACSEGA
jgi:alpha-L-rhamnosidase